MEGQLIVKLFFLFLIDSPQVQIVGVKDIYIIIWWGDLDGSPNMKSLHCQNIFLKIKALRIMGEKG